MNMLEKIQLMMKERNLNMADISKGARIPYNTVVGLFKKGYQRMKLPTLIKLSNYFKVSIDYLANDKITDMDHKEVPKQLSEIRDTDSKFEEDLKTIITTIADGFTKETVNRNIDIVKKIKSIYDKNPDRFFDLVFCAKVEFNAILQQIINIPAQKNQYILPCITSGLYKHFFEILMEKKEGSICSADKAKFIQDTTIKALREKENLSLYEDYSKCKQIKHKNKQAYWSPRTIKDTDTAMKMFWNWYLIRR